MSIVNLTRNDFKTEVMQSDKTVLIDFWAEWCGPCRMMSPVIDEVAETLSDVKVCKFNVDEASDLASMFGIESIPTLVVIKNGQTVNKSIGLISKEQVLQLLNV